jgi:flavodoxin
MNIIIVYDSLYGNTEKIANVIAQEFSSHKVHIVKAKDVTKDAARDVDLIIVGSPTHGGRPSSGTKEFLSQIAPDSLKNIRGASFTTGISTEGQNIFFRFIIWLMGYADKHIARVLNKNGARIVGEEIFFVLEKDGPLKEGELERAKKWASEILNK